MNKIFSRKSQKSGAVKNRNSIRSLTFKQTIALLALATIFLFGASAYYWYKNIFVNPDRVLSDMLDKSLQVSNTQRRVNQSQADSSLDQAVYVSFAPQLISDSKSELSEITTLGRTVVRTDNIGTKDADYVRYEGIDIPGDRSGRDFREIIGVWGKRESQSQSGQSAAFLRETLFTAVPFGNLDNSQRHELKEEIKRVNLYQYQEAKKEYIDGRPVMTYKINLDPHALVTVLGKYAEITGLGRSPELNPALYEGAQRVPINLRVDLLSRHASTIGFEGTDRLEMYGAYNSFRNVIVPQDTIDVNELQDRLQRLEQRS
jgi:hypothetical protein